GEFGLIDLLAKMAGGGDERLLIGIGDDAAAWQGDASIQLASVDSFIEGVHFPPGIAPWPELGGKALAVNLSDIAAMGGIPRYALVSLALPDSTEVEDVTALYKGMLDLAKQYGVTIVGGDISSAPLVAITITVLGTSPKKQLLTRSNARPGELIAITGYLGAAAAGLEMLTKKLKFDPQATELFKQAFLNPSPRIAEGQLLVEQGVKTAIDISDGLLADLGQIGKASKVGARIEAERVPIEPLVKAAFGERALELALSGGEDYELLFTASAEVIERVKKAASCPITVIGEIVAGDGVSVVDRQGKPLSVVRAGWEHFSQR
ncbi:MAG TPA: thiamine-phosphate kinase, partial [Dehalococcoidia bacterium]|nr:thiamine-phosphate kinase [Dehalococcoidia bacterium]